MGNFLPHIWSDFTLGILKEGLFGFGAFEGVGEGVGDRWWGIECGFHVIFDLMGDVVGGGEM